MPLDNLGRHSHGTCTAAGASTRVHHAIRHCVANFCRKVGLNSEEEVVIPELHERAHDGTVKEARMDVVVWRPGGFERRMIDVRTVDGKCATAIALGGTEGAFRSAEQEKQRRYKGHAHALSVELSGGIASTGLSLLERLSWEAAIAKPSDGSPTRRQWCRELELVLAFEAAEALRAVHGDSKLRSSCLFSLPCAFPCFSCERTDLLWPLKEPRQTQHTAHTIHTTHDTRQGGRPWAPEISTLLFSLRSGHPDIMLPLNCRTKWRGRARN